MRLLSLACVTSLALGACVASTDDSTFEISNESSYTITEVYLTDIGNPSWGSNLLGGDVLYPNESFVLGVNCGTYDALLVDETNVECELHNLDLCFNDAVWVIRNNTCSVFGAREADTPDATKQAPAAELAK